MKPRQETELGMEQFCAQCPDGGYWWPLTTEFWYFRPNGNTNGPCIACQAESRIKNADKPCCVPGCKRPRHATSSRVESRCLEHRREYERIRVAHKKALAEVQR